MTSAKLGSHTRWKEKIDGVAHRRRRELQVVRAEALACKHAAETLYHDMVDERVKLDAAVDEYESRKTALAERQAEAHHRLTLVLQNRSAAEQALKTVRDRTDNELKARRTAGTVRAYRLDARWRQLHGRYRGFVTDVLHSDGDGHRTAGVGEHAAAKAGGTGRRFFAVADKFSSQYRRESLRTSRSLHALMAGYLRETSGVSGTAAKDQAWTTSHRRSLATLDGAGPEQVLDKLRVMQEQCARIAERVRRRTGGSGGEERGRRSGQPDRHDGDKRRQADLLSDARDRLVAGREYVQTIRGLMDRAVADVQRDQHELRKALGSTCAACIGTQATQLQDRSLTVVEMAGRLENACFALFSRLDRTGTAVRRRDDLDHRTAPATANDVVTLCLRTVQTNRANTVRRAHDVAFRVNDFRKAVNRLLLATSTATSVRRRKSKVSPELENSAESRIPRPALGRLLDNMTAVALPPHSSPKNTSASESTAAAPTDTVAVTMLCPPSIGIVKYE